MATPLRSFLPDVSRPPFAGAPEARFEPAPADGVLPEGFFSTSNLPTYVRIGERLGHADPAADGWRHRPAGRERSRPWSRGWCAGSEPVAIGLAEDGSEGIVVHVEGFLGGGHQPERVPLHGDRSQP